MNNFEPTTPSSYDVAWRAYVSTALAGLNVEDAWRHMVSVAHPNHHPDYALGETLAEYGSNRDTNLVYDLDGGEIEHKGAIYTLTKYSRGAILTRTTSTGRTYHNASDVRDGIEMARCYGPGDDFAYMWAEAAPA